MHVSCSDLSGVCRAFALPSSLRDSEQQRHWPQFPTLHRDQGTVSASDKLVQCFLSSTKRSKGDSSRILAHLPRRLLVAYFPFREFVICHELSGKKRQQLPTTPSGVYCIVVFANFLKQKINVGPNRLIVCVTPWRKLDIFKESHHFQTTQFIKEWHTWGWKAFPKQGMAYMRL